MEKTYICPFCGETIKLANPHHLKKCKGFNDFIEKNKNEIYELYYNQEWSMVEISEYFKINYNHAQAVFRYLNWEVRSSKESNSTKRIKEKQAKTNLEKYGVVNVFQRESKIRQDFEKRLWEEEGIINVFQREDVKQKIKETFHKKYSDEEIYYNYIKGSTLQYWIDKLGEEEGKKEYERICFEKGKSGRLSYYQEVYGDNEGERIFRERTESRMRKTRRMTHTSINDGMDKILSEYNFSFKREVSIKRDDDNNKHYTYDFLIENKLFLEMNGDFWHANPTKYKKHDTLHFPGRYVIAEDLWKKDEHKKQLVINKGYKFLTIWESDFHKMNENEILNLINYELSKN